MTKAVKKIPMFFHEFKGKAIPDIDLDSYRLVIDGEVERRLELKLTELETLVPPIKLQRRFYCVNGWSLEAVWTGFDLGAVLALVQPFPEAPYLRATSVGGYEDTTRIDHLLNGGAMLVTHMDGEPLSPERGKPIRLMIFDRYQFKGVKAVARIEIVKEYRPGAWVKYGYTDATIQPFPHFAVDKGDDLMPEPEVLGLDPDEFIGQQ
jgi:DMSO/TMAO reductase YedYZ molybdopterin-dependent catalytic subunit